MSNDAFTMNSGDDRLMRVAEVIDYLGISRSTLWKKVSEGSYPKPIHIGARLTRWRASDIQSLIREGTRNSCEKTPPGSRDQRGSRH